MLDGLVVGWGRACTGLCAFNDVIRDIRATSDHGLDCFANDVAVATVHLLLELLLMLGVWVANSVLQFFEGCRCRWVW